MKTVMEFEQNNSLVTMQRGNVCFCISCVWISCLSRCVQAISWNFDKPMDNPIDKHTTKVVLGNEMVSHLLCELFRIA